jgi:hypothetical protein
MLLSVMSVAAMAATPMPTGPIAGDVVGHVRRNAAQTTWERYDLRLTNHGADPQSLSFCPQDAQLFFRKGLAEAMMDMAPGIWVPRGGVSKPHAMRGFATAAGGESWSYNCVTHSFAPGASKDVSFYFRYLSLRKGGSPFLVDTSLGRLLVQDGKATLYQAAGAPEGQGEQAP